MKLSKLFHTLYAAVMGMPLLIIPIFAININQKSVEPISIEVQEKQTVDFNQIVTNYLFENTQNWIGNAGNDFNVTTSNNVLSLSTPLVGDYYRQYIFENRPTHKYLYKIDFMSTVNDNRSFIYIFRGSASGPVIIQKNSTNADGYYHTIEGIFTCVSGNIPFFRLMFGMNNVTNNFMYPQLYDLTQGYGEGNEPTVEEFNNTFEDSYYPYTVSQKVLVDKTTPTTYDDTDIGSQFLYSLYKPVRDYFNFGEFFGLSGMYDWFQLNIFNGTAPLSFFIVFNVMIYWLFISLFWLLFDILIYVPMVIHKWLDKAEM